MQGGDAQMMRASSSTVAPMRGASVPRPGVGLTTPAPRRGEQMPIAGASRRRRTLIAILLGLAAVNLAGAPYYLLPMAARVRHPWHAWLKPTGLVGQSAGVGALALFLFLWLYPLRKKFRFLAFTGSIARWLDVHIGAGLIIPILAATHAAWHFTGLIGLGYAAMMVVVLSGFVGRYLYARIPRSRSGAELGREEIEKERHVLVRYLATQTGLPAEEVERLLAPTPIGAAGGIAGWFARMLRDDVERFRAARRLAQGARTGRDGARRDVDRRVLRLVRRMARREMALAQQVRLLDATHQVFRFWHVAHRPVAIAALVAVVVHVGVAVAMGVTWFL